MKRKPLVYFADLRHYYLGVLSTDSMPLAVGNMKAVMDRDLPEVESRIFVFPETLDKAMRETPPDAILLSNYIWNEALSLHFAHLAKTLNPNALTVMGGPNFYTEDDRKIKYMKEHPFLDFYVVGEADFTCTTLLEAYLDAGCDPEKMRQNELANTIYRRGDTYFVGAIEKRRRDLDSIPSPWLTGVMDEFFDGKLMPLFETNRGCPFTCTFCVQGGRWWSKVNYFSMDRIKEEIYYIAKRIKEQSPNQKALRLADLNYGMYERDVEISGWFGEVQRDYDWPLLIDATTGKNQAERIIRSMEKVNGALVLYQAVQSLDEDVLLNVKRKNISVDAYAEIQMHIRGRGLRSSSDLILGLPGESLKTHLSSIEKLIDSGTHKLNNFQAMLLKGSEMETKASREKYGFTTKFRLLPKNFGRYGGEKIVGVEEIIVATNTLSFEDYLEARKVHFGVMVFWNSWRFEPLLKLAQNGGHTNWDWLQALIEEIEHHQELRELMKRFVEETKEELFDDRESALTEYHDDDTFRRLENDEVGDNLLYRNGAIAKFMEWPSTCDCAVAATRKLMSKANGNGSADIDPAFWADMTVWLDLSHAHGKKLVDLFKVRDAKLQYAISDWIEAGSPRDVAPFKSEGPSHYKFELSAENSKNISAAVDVWNYDVKTLSMLVKRVQPAWFVRETRLLGAKDQFQGAAV